LTKASPATLQGTVYGSITSAEMAVLQGTVRLSTGQELSGVLVSVVDPLGTRTAITDTQGNYTVTGIIAGAYSMTYSGDYLMPMILTGTLAPGQTVTKNVFMSFLPITLTVSSPLEGATVASSTLTVTGNVANAQSILLRDLDDPDVTEYPGVIANGSFTALMPVAPGLKRVAVVAAHPYKNTEKLLNATVTAPPFMVRNLGDTGNVAVMEASGVFDARNPDGTTNDTPRQEIAKEYIRTHGDNFDFLVFVSTFDYALPESGAEGFYLPVRNDVQGINQQIFDSSAQFGSNSKLQGTIDLGNITQLATAPYGPLLDTNVRLLNHELMHRFGSYVRFNNPDGSLNTSLLGKDSAHWSYLLDSKGSIMYGNGWKDNGDGTFNSVSSRSSYRNKDRTGQDRIEISLDCMMPRRKWDGIAPESIFIAL